jgi:hypothetical protein
MRIDNKAFDEIRIGDFAQMQQMLPKEEIDLFGLLSGEAETLMKGSLHTDELMGALVYSAAGTLFCRFRSTKSARIPT